jgi:hypothetical protein
VAFLPDAKQELHIESVAYWIAEHPAAPGLPYGQEGRQAVVFQLAAQDGDAQALKVFKPRYRLPALVGQAAKIAPLADLPGLQVCRRTVLSARRNRDLLRQHPDLTYAVLMPWVQGPTWMEVMIEKRELTPEQSLELARSLAEILATMEEHGLAHCDLSGPNVLLPSLVASAVPNYGSSIQLVDVEQLYSSDLKRPELLPGGSPGYAHKTAPDGLWGSTADRFAGAVLLGEMLGWCDERAREAAWGENYFEPQEMQRESERYQTLVATLQERWGNDVVQLFERAWRSEVLADCATFGEWLVTLPEEVPVVETTQVDVPPKGMGAGQPSADEGTITVLLDLGRRLEEQDNVAGALEVYRQAQALASVGSGLAEELALIVRDMEAKQEEAPGVTSPVPQPPVEEKEAAAIILEPQPVEETAEEEELVAPAPRSALEQELALIEQDVETEQEELAVLAPESSLEGKVEAEVAAPDTEPPPGEKIEAEEVAPLPPVSEEIGLDRLFDEGLVAYKREEWAKAKELLTEVVRRQPDYEKDGQKASSLLAEAEGQLTQKPRSTPSTGVSDKSAVVIAIAALALFAIISIIAYSNYQTEQRGMTQATALEQYQATFTAQRQATATEQARATATVYARSIATVQARATEVRDKSTTFVVEAGQIWQDTGVDVSPGEILKIAYVSGEWWDDSRHVAVDGISGLSYSDFSVIKGCPHGALIAQLRGREPFCVARTFFGRLEQAGALQLQINDTVITDNSGEITVRIQVR